MILLAVLSAAVATINTLGVSGSDMAVVIAVLNSGSGWGGVAAGFMISNELLIVTGAFVGASGAILAYIMCQAMNLDILRVLGLKPPKARAPTRLMNSGFSFSFSYLLSVRITGCRKVPCTASRYVTHF